MSEKAQTIALKPKAHSAGWTEFEVRSMSHSGETDSRTTIRTPGDSLFVDISIEEYTGISRRAKLTSVRLEEAAARQLYEVLSAKFGAAR